MLKKIKPRQEISTFIKNYKKPEIHHHSHHKKHKKKWTFWIIVRDLILIGLALGFLSAAAIAIYISTITVPDFSDFANRKIENSTRIYDRTGKILLYDVHGDVKRQVVSSDQISNLSKEATVAIEDKHFYTHHGIRITSIIRAMIENLKAGSFVQGGSTIDQQIIKNTLLTTKKTIPRKIKEWAMAIKLDSQLTKDQILTIYLNDADYGGQISGIQTAAKYFFNKDASDLDLAEAAYLAAIPNAPSYYSPYGDHVADLEVRKNLVLKNMLDQGMISNEQYLEAKNEKVTWQQNIDQSKAMQFVMYVKSYLEQKYGEDMVYNGGLKVITTLNVDYQERAQEIVKKYALQNEKDYNAKNGAMVVIDPKTGQILVMVGSRDYNDTEIDGKYNVAIHQNRQPGSSFKPIVYATAFEKGYTPDSVVFDVPTEFSTNCNPDGTPIPPRPATDCYHPQNYDSSFVGPISLRDALAQSLNVPAVKVLYLAGIKNSVSTAETMGITSLDPNGNYGLSLVLGAAPVSLLELTNAYAVFADEGVYNPYAFILEVDDSQGNVLEKYTPQPKQVLPKFISDEITSILADNEARTPLEGANSPLYFPGHDVAAKTGTTNEFRDAWTIGYTPNIVVGVWAGNNNNQQINKGLSGLVAVPMWSEFMGSVLDDYPNDKFDTPQLPPNLKPTDNTPPVSGVYCYSQNGQNYAYSILNSDSPQYNLWKVPADNWMSTHPCPFSQLPGNSSSTNVNNYNNQSTSPVQINYTF